MCVEQRKGRSGRTYYSIRSTENGKIVGLKKSETPNFKSLKEAEDWANSQDAYRDSQKKA